MKVRELLQPSKPSPSPRAARAAEAETKSSQFASALDEARRKPEPKPAEAEPSPAKKPAAAKKKGEATSDQEPAADAVTADAPAAEDVQQQPAPDEAETIASEDGSAADPEGSGDSAASEEEAADAEAAALAMTQAQLPQAPAALADTAIESDEGAAVEGPRQICPDRPIWQPKPQAVNDDGKPSEGAATSEDVAATVLQGFEMFDESVTEAVDAAPPGDKPAAAMKQPAQPAPTTAGEAVPKATRKTADAADQAHPDVAGEAAAGALEVATGEHRTTSVADGPADLTTGAAATSAAHVQPDAAKAPAMHAAPAPAAAPLPPQAHFVETNHPTIVTAVQTQALTNGGSIQIRLDPPELGALQVLVHMQDGVMTASFQTSNDDATRLLSHSLSQLKQVLESQGVSVEKLQVQQASKDQQAGNQGEDRQHQRDQQDDAHRQEQQRKEMLRRMWRRLANGSDPLDLVA